ncbi:hypothetical protein TanjilG_12986 [Lupinus angustifolius]|uniref:Calcium uniporter protein C-terminal domain-containing protein n=1 Tax=Lupinus angustifolius TaxID=3871 RepID=A0A1J7G2T5_LUPAN|nr:PREDICTED: calcium uniporter protein 2, mitochondrial-like [Lupinus angustifolius]OIV94773.1 hypothetical protein TanjilG_12986 [Lupinus angustifolius]
MALKKTLFQRLFNITKISSQTINNCRISSSSVHGRTSSSTPTRPDFELEPGDNAIFSRFMNKRTEVQPELRSPAFSGSLIEKLRDMDIARTRIRLEGLAPPVPEKVDALEEERVAVEDARKLLKAAQVELVKSKLREIQKTCISVSEFFRICSENCSDRDQAARIAKMLDESAVVIILGDVVFLRPEQIANAIHGLLPQRGAKVDDSVRKEFEEMERKKAAIDNRADTFVRCELWGGLGFLVVQTIAFMRLTFWELTWDVMEPVCFYLTSMYFMAGYTFFLRTSKEPSFEGFYQARFSTKQKRLMKLHNFDIGKYNELRALCSPSTLPKLDSFAAHPFDHYPQHN